MVCNSKLHQTLPKLFSSRCQLQVQKSRPDWHRIWLGSPLLSKETARTPWSYWWSLPPSTTMARRALSPPCPHLCSPEPTRLSERHWKTARHPGHQNVRITLCIYIYVCMFVYVCLSMYLCICMSGYDVSLCISLCVSLYVLSVSLYIIYVSIHRSVCLSVSLSVCLSVRPSVRLSVRPSVRLSLCLSVYLSIDRSIDPLIHLSIYPSISLSLNLSVYLSLCL